MGLVAPLPPRPAISRRKWARGWRRIARDMGCNRRFSWLIYWMAYIEGPAAYPFPAPDTLVIEQDHIDAQRENAWTQ